MRNLLVLARISNLPTVWSNCFAASLLVGGTPFGRLALLCLAASLLYTGGMFLNDAVDQEFDRRYRPERPIVAGKISARAVWVLSWVLLAAGWILLVFLGAYPAVLGSALLAAIVWYDFVHKRTVLAPILMAACRFLLYLVAAVAANPSQLPLVWLPAAALAAFIIGLSYMARRESTGGVLSHWPSSLLFAPALLAVLSHKQSKAAFVTAFAVQVVWTSWCILPAKFPRSFPIPTGVAGLLAGIVWVDWLAVGGTVHAIAFVLLFCSAILCQRIAPAT